MSISKKLVTNAFFLLLDFATVFVVSFLFWILIWKNLTPTESGIFSVAQNFIILVASITTFGFSSAVSKLIPEYVATGKNEVAHTLIRFALKATILTSFVGAIIIYFSTPIIGVYLGNFPNDAVIFVSFGIVFLTLESILGSVLLGFQRTKRYFSSDILGNIIKIIVAFVLIVFGFRYIGPIAGLVVGFLFVTLFRIDMKWFKKNKASVDKKHVLYNYSLPSLFSSFGSIILTNSPYIIIAYFGGLAVTGIFTAALTITSQLTILVGILSSAIFPVVSELSVSKNMKSKQSEVINLGLKYGVLITLPVALLLILVPRSIILLLSQTKYLPAADILPILSLAYFMMGVSIIFTSSLYAIKRPKTSRNIWLLSAIVFLLTSIPMTIYYSSIGISASFLFSILVLFSLSLFYLRKYLKFELNWKNILKIVIAGLVLVAFVFAADIFSLPTIDKYLLGFAGLILYFVLLLPMRFFTKDDIRLLEVLSEEMPFMKSLFLFVSKVISKFL